MRFRVFGKQPAGKEVVMRWVRKLEVRGEKEVRVGGEALKRTDGDSRWVGKWYVIFPF